MLLTNELRILFELHTRRLPNHERLLRPCKWLFFCSLSWAFNNCIRIVKEVEPMYKESDHIHVIALTNATQMPASIVYLDRGDQQQATKHNFPEDKVCKVEHHHKFCICSFFYKGISLTLLFSYLDLKLQ